MPLPRRHGKPILAWLLLALLLVAAWSIDSAEAQLRKSKKKKKLEFTKYCNGTSCEALTYFYANAFIAPNKTTCLWTRLEVDLPKYTEIAFNSSFITLLRNPGSPNCKLENIEVATPEPFALNAPTLDCFTDEGCLCDSIQPEANKHLNWQPITKLLKKGETVKRDVCKDTRTYVYLRVNCPLDPAKQEKVLEDPYADINYVIDDYDGYPEPPITLRLAWTSRQNGTKVSPKDKDVRAYCRSDVNNGAPAANRWFLLVLVSISALLVIVAAAGQLVWALILLVKKPASPGKEEVGKEDAEAANVEVASEPGLIANIFKIEYREGRNRWFTAFLLAAAGLYIVGLIFEPRLRPESAYDRKISPTLQGALLDLVKRINLDSYGQFFKRLARIILTIMLCTTWGTVVFFALLLNLSGHSKPAVHTIKAALSAFGIALLDVGIVMNLMATFSYSDKWNTAPGAIWFLFISEIVLIAIANILALVVFFSKPTHPSTPELEDAGTQTGAKQDNTKVNVPSLPQRETLDDRVVNQLSRKDVDEKEQNDSSKPPGFMAKLKGAAACFSSGLCEDKTFHYSPWFIAPMVISFVLVIFFFIREIYLLKDLEDCLDLRSCPRWSHFNSALIPIISTALQPALTGSNPMAFVQHIAQGMVNNSAAHLLSSVTTNYDYNNMAQTILTQSEPLLPTNLTYIDGEDEIALYYNMRSRPPVLVLDGTHVPWRGGDQNITTENEYFVTVNISPTNQLLVNGSTWGEWFLSSAEFNALCEDQDVPYNVSAVSNYLESQAQASYTSLLDSSGQADILDDLANSFGISGQELVKQVYAASIGPYIDYALCDNVTDKVVSPITQVRQVLKTLLGGAITRTANTTEAQLKQKMSTDESFQKLQRRIHKVNKFYEDLRKSFGIGAYIGAGIAITVSMVSMVIICMVYKKAVVNLSRQMAVAKRLGLTENQDLGAEMGLRVTMQLENAEGAADGQGQHALGVVPDSGVVQMFALVEAIKRQTIYPAIMFYGCIFSTVLIQMILVSVLFAFVFTLLLHPSFWSFTFSYLLGFILALIITQLITSIVVSGIVGRMVAPNSKIKNQSAWIAYFIIFSFAYIILGIIMALVRLILILVGGIIMSCRIDLCLNAVSKGMDPCYNSFLSMMKMQTEMKLVAETDLAEGADAAAAQGRSKEQ